jgi:hypothetical protein
VWRRPYRNFEGRGEENWNSSKIAPLHGLANLSFWLIDEILAQTVPRLGLRFRNRAQATSDFHLVYVHLECMTNQHIQQGGYCPYHAREKNERAEPSI